MNCAAPSCSYQAEPGSQFCDVHNGRAVEWFSVRKPDGRTVNIRTTREHAETLGQIKTDPRKEN
jgi:hypothetical protein